MKSCFVKDGLSACNSWPFVFQYVAFYNAICRLLECVSYIAGFQYVKKKNDAYAFNSPMFPIQTFRESVQ